MASHDYNIANGSGAAVRSDINDALSAIVTWNSGTSWGTTFARQRVVDTTLGVVKRRNAANGAWIIESTDDETRVMARSSNTILDESDFGKTVVATSTFTQTFTAAATLGDGWWVEYRNDGTGTITFDPNSSELIDGSTTLVLEAGQSCIVMCDGAAFKTIGRTTYGGQCAIENGHLTYSVGSSALTIALKTMAGNDPSAANPVVVWTRSATAATGSWTRATVTAALSLVISSGSTVGTVSSVPFRLWTVIFNDGGTIRLGAINCLSTAAAAGSGRDVTAIYPLAAWGIASSTAEGGAGAADNAQTFYTGTAVTSKAYAVVGYATWESGLGTAGTWSAGPTRAQNFGPGVPLPGYTLQLVGNATGAVATGTTTVPNDDSIPQNTEGDQYLSQAITPTSAANVLAIEAQLAQVSSSVASQLVTTSLHQDSVANALATVSNTVDANGLGGHARLSHSMQAATASATTMKIRSGQNAAATTTVNGQSGNRRYGGVLRSFIEVKELMA